MLYMLCFQTMMDQEDSPRRFVHFLLLSVYNAMLNRAFFCYVIQVPYCFVDCSRETCTSCSYAPA